MLTVNRPDDRRSVLNNFSIFPADQSGGKAAGTVA
jgi:hypothetical protein